MTRRAPSSPRLARWLLHVLLPRAEREVIIGDLEEVFARRLSRHESGARARYWRDALASVVMRSWRRRGALWEADRGTARAGLAPGHGFLRSAGGWRSDMRLALRRLRSGPRLTIIVASTLGLGIGAVTVVYSAVDQALLAPMPGVREPQRVAVVEFKDARTGEGTVISDREFDELRALAGAADSMAGYFAIGLHAQSVAGPPTGLMGQAIVGDWFALLGVHAIVGRLLDARETTADANPDVAVISESLWTTMFGHDPAIIGRTLRVNGQSLTIIGVAGGGFRGVVRDFDVAAWVPLAALARLDHDNAAAPRRYYLGQLVVRLRDGSTAAASEAALGQAFARLASAHPEASSRFTGYRPRLYPGIGTDPAYRKRMNDTARLLLVAVAVLLLIACVNVTNLLLLRGSTRQGEVAVRRALGAGAIRIARQMAIENGVLALLGGGVGVLAATVLGRLLQGRTLVGFRDYRGFRPNVRVLGIALLTTLLALLLSGILPALLQRRPAPATVMRGRTRHSTGRQGALRAALSGTQLALSLSLLVGALLLTRTVRNLQAVSLGFQIDRVYSTFLDFFSQGMPAPAERALAGSVLTALRALPGVESAAAGSTIPFWGRSGAVRLLHPSGADTATITSVSVTDGYMETLRAPLLRGRTLTEADATDGEVTPVLITPALARRLFGDGDAVGRVLRSPVAASGRQMQYRVVGVTGELRMESPAEEAGETLYAPAHFDSPRLMLVVRAHGEDRALRAALDNAIHETTARLAPEMAVPRLSPLQEALDARLGQRRLLARLLNLLALLTATLAGIGLYGVIAYSVAERTREMGIRVALGARAAALAALVLRPVGVILIGGIAAGLLGALVIGRLVASQLFGVNAVDPATWLAAVLFFAFIALLAALAPLRSATGLDPMIVLRQD